MAEALVSFLVKQLDSITYRQVEQKVRLVVNVNKEVATLTVNLEAIQVVLADAEKRQVKEANVRRWLSDLKQVSCELDDVLDEWSTEILKRQIEKQENEGENAILAKKKKVCFSMPFHCLRFGQVNQIIYCPNIAERIKELNEKLILINEQGNFLKFQRLEKNNDQQPERLKSIVKSRIYGRDKEKNFLVSQLKSENSQERMGPLVISVVGMGGIGKTTLAQLAYNDEDVKHRFDMRIWVSVSNPFVQTVVAKSIIEDLNKIVPELETLDQQVYDSVKRKRFLLVLDDVWDSNHTEWDLFMRILQSGARGSIILVTTRIREVASVLGATIDHTIILTELKEEICQSLFYDIASFDDENEESRMFKKVGNEIVKKCMGSPLATKTLGKLMCSKKTIQEWNDVLNSNKIWELRYNNLEPPTKRCLLYCALFPKKCEIYKDELIELWMSQDYFNVKEGNKGNKIIGQRYFENLVMQSFFQDFVKDDNENIISCKMHNSVHDFVSSLTKDEYFTKDDYLSMDFEGAKERMELPEAVRHFTLLYAPEDPFPVCFRNSKSLRTLTSFYSKLTSIGVEEISQLKCLRTLNLSGNYITEVPKDIGGLIHLRYLDLSNNPQLKELPDSICDLHNLQTLRLKFCHQLVKLPDEEAMRKLANLKHLYVRSSCGLKSQGIRRLRNLKTLDVFHVHHEGLRLEDLEKLHQLEGTLSIRNLRYVKDASKAEKVMNKKHNILHLDLNFGCQACSRPQIWERKLDGEIVNALQPHSDLQSLSIRQFNAKTLCPNWMMLLQKLRTLALNWCPNCEVLPPLGNLQSLESLTLSFMYKLKTVGVEFLGALASVSFPKLKRLVFHEMPVWDEWVGDAEDPQKKKVDFQRKIMPSLHFLEFDRVVSLKTLPTFLCKTQLHQQNLVFKNSCPNLQQERAKFPKYNVDAKAPNRQFANIWSEKLR